MACSLHKLIENEKDSRRIPYYREASKTQFDARWDLAIELAPQAQCFDMGAEELSAGLKSIPELIRLPYPVCWFEGRAHDDTAPVGFNDLVIGMLCSEVNGDIGTFIFARTPKHENWALMRVISLRDIDKEFNGGPSGSIPWLVDWLCGYLSALNCINVGLEKNHVDRKLQKAREKRGKLPLFDYWTLAIDLQRGPSDRREPIGTHSSPRVHLRRGHARQLGDGKWCWVRASVVGNKASGLVCKEYATA